MKERHFKDDHIGMVVTHNLGTKMTVVGLDPRNQSDSFYIAEFAYCRYRNEVSGAMEVSAFHAREFEFPKEEEKEDD